MSTYELGVESPYVFQAVANYELAFRDMEKALAQNPAGWLVGTAMTLADVNMMPFVARLSYLQLAPVWIADRPHVMAWWARVQTLPSFRKAVHDPLTPREIEAMATYGARIGDRVAERRLEYLAQVQAGARPPA